MESLIVFVLRFETSLSPIKWIVPAGAFAIAGLALAFAPDWCHFSQRLPRLRAHKQVKRAELPFEDEKFAYVALMRTPLAPRPSRVLAQPRLSKVEVTAKLCTAEGLVLARVPRRDASAYAAARRWRWGGATS